MTAAALSRGPASGLLAAALSLRETLNRFPAPVLKLLLRAGVASVFWKSGMTKLANWELTVQLFADEYNVPLLPPELAAWLATAAELICPVLILFGLGARLGAAALLGMTVVIQTFVYPANWSEHLLWASILLTILTHGPGSLSLDHLIARRCA